MRTVYCTERASAAPVFRGRGWKLDNFNVMASLQCSFRGIEPVKDMG